MASTILKAYTTEGTHNVGNINSINVLTLANGAVVKTADMDNWVIAKLDGTYDADTGRPNCVVASAATDRGYLVASPEQRFLGEEVNNFYNEVGEPVRLVILQPNYTRIEVSNHSFNAGVTEVVKGLVAHFDPTTKKYILSTAGAAHAAYATAGHQFEVVGDLDDTSGHFTESVVRLMCTK